MAIPAYMFYNKFTNKVNVLNSKMVIFGDELLNIINSRLDIKFKDNSNEG